jgi:hypothetical protein
MHDNGSKIWVDYPNVGDARRPISRDLFVDLLDRVGRREDFHDHRGYAVYVGRLIGLYGNDLRRDIHNVDSDSEIGISTQADAALATIHLPARLRLLIEPKEENCSYASHDAAMKPVSDCHGLLTQFAVDEPPIHPVFR